MINDFVKLLEVWRRDKFGVHSRYVYKIPHCQCLFARRGLVTSEKRGPKPSKVQDSEALSLRGRRVDSDEE